MTSFTPAPKPEPAPPKQRSYIARESAKHKAKRLATPQSVSRTKAPAKRNLKRKRSEFARTFHSVERVQWVKSLPCLACLLVDRIYGWGTVENCHVTDDGTKGASRRSGFACIVPLCRGHHVRFDEDWNRFKQTGEVSPHWRMVAGQKNTGGSWFNVGSPGQKQTNNNPVHEGQKGGGGSWFGTYAERKARWDGNQSLTSSGSIARKRASAKIAKIPLPLASHIARVYKPRSASEAA